MILELTPGTAVARYDSYAEAQAAVDLLADRGHDVEGIRIVANDLRIVEYVTGTRGWVNSILRGAGIGALIGWFIAAFIAAFSIIDSVGAFWTFMLWGLVLGAVSGALWTGIDYWADRGRRDFFSVSGLTAGSYDVVVPDGRAQQAVAVLENEPAAVAAP